MKRMFQLAALSFSLSLAGQTHQVIIPVHCGDPCSPNESQSGCRCEGRRDICTCINGHWSTFP